MKKKYGPGDILHLILEHYGYKKKDNCDCDDHIFFMNHWGPIGCEDKLDVITNWIVKSATDFSFIYKIRPIKVLIRPIIKSLVSISIRISKEHQNEYDELEIKNIITTYLP